MDIITMILVMSGGALGAFAAKVGEKVLDNGTKAIADGIVSKAKQLLKKKDSEELKPTELQKVIQDEEIQKQVKTFETLSKELLKEYPKLAQYLETTYNIKTGNVTNISQTHYGFGDNVGRDKN